MGNLLASLHATAEQVASGHSLQGKVALVTGGSSGIGLETVRVLAKAGAKVVVPAPKPEKAQDAIEKIKPEAGRDPQITIMQLDLASFKSIREFVAKFISEVGRVDLLVLNAAVMQTPQWKTREGFEYQTGVNYLGHVELAKGLLEGLILGQANESRIIVTTCKLPLESPAQMQWRDLNFKTRPYSSSGAYAQSKIALAVWGNELAGRQASFVPLRSAKTVRSMQNLSQTAAVGRLWELQAVRSISPQRKTSLSSAIRFKTTPLCSKARAMHFLVSEPEQRGREQRPGQELRRLAETNIGVFIVHPGVAVTRLNRFLPFFSVLYDAMVAPFVKSVPQAAATTVHCCVSKKAWETGHGEFFESCKPGGGPRVLYNKTLSKQLWDKTEELLQEAQLDSHEPIDYNYFKLVFNRFHELFLAPLLQKFHLLRAPQKQQ